MTDKEEIQKCLNCELPECIDCLSYRLDDKKLSGMLGNRRPFSELDTTHLSPRQRQVFELYMQGHNDEEISEALGITKDDVRGYRGRTKLSALPKTDLEGRREFIARWVET